MNEKYTVMYNYHIPIYKPFVITIDCATIQEPYDVFPFCIISPSNRGTSSMMTKLPSI